MKTYSYYLTVDLDATASRGGTTYCVLLFAVLSTLLHRYTGQKRCRPALRQQNRRLFKYLEADFSDNPSLTKLLEQLRLQTESLSSADRAILDKIAARDFLEFVLPACFMRKPAWSHITFMSPEYYKSGLSLICEPRHAEGLRLILKINGGVASPYTQEIMEQIAGHFQNLLSDMTTYPEKPVSALQMLSPEEINHLTVEWNGVVIPYEERCIHEFFEDQAERTPDAVALMFKDRRMTYRELNVRANTLAHSLCDLGAKPEVVVGIGMERSLQAAICVLAVLKSGASYTVIAPDFPPDRIRDVVSLSGAKTVLTSLEHASKFCDCGAKVLSVNVLSDAHENQNRPENIHSGVTVDNVAYVLFTSGSTGKPKGVVGIHRSIAHLFCFGRFGYMTGPDYDICCQNAPLGFLGAVSGLLLPLCCGLPVVIIPDGEERDPHTLAKIIDKTGISNLSMVPAMLKQLSSLGADAKKLLKTVKRVGVSGSVLDRDTITAFRRIMPQAMLMVGYASTEIGSVAFGHFVDLKHDGKKGPVPLGKPGPDIQVYILDRYMNPVPTGVPGELYIAADHMARGYAGQPELTAERFLPDPFIPGKRLFRTGDVMCFRPDGEVEYLGRADNQVKVRGFRVELGEVETIIATCPGVDEVVVIKNEQEKSQRLVAYVVKKPGVELNTAVLREYLEKRLPWYMIPSAFFLLRQMPLGANGKIDRYTMSLNRLERPTLENEYVSPKDGIEAELTEIWQMVLGVRDIGIHDEFLEIGGESLLAAVIAIKIYERFSVEIPLPLFFANLTIATLAEEISRIRAESD